MLQKHPRYKDGKELGDVMDKRINTYLYFTKGNIVVFTTILFRLRF